MLSDITPNDLAALILTRPAERHRLDAMTAPESELAATIAAVLAWCDELRLQRANDEIFEQLERQAAVALATTPEGLAALDTPNT